MVPALGVAIVAFLALWNICDDVYEIDFGMKGINGYFALFSIGYCGFSVSMMTVCVDFASTALKNGVFMTTTIFYLQIISIWRTSLQNME